MSTNDRHTTITRDESIHLSNGEVRPVPHSRDGKTYRTDVVLLKWVRRDDGPWALISTTLAGRVLKRDGSDSKNHARERFYAADNYPDWLRELIDDTDPSEES